MKRGTQVQVVCLHSPYHGEVGEVMEEKNPVYSDLLYVRFSPEGPWVSFITKQLIAMPKPTLFRKGDHVEVVRERNTYYQKKGVITEARNSHHIRVQIQGEGTHTFREGDIVLDHTIKKMETQPIPTPLSIREGDEMIVIKKGHYRGWEGVVSGVSTEYDGTLVFLDFGIGTDNVSFRPEDLRLIKKGIPLPEVKPDPAPSPEGVGVGAYVIPVKGWDMPLIPPPLRRGDRVLYMRESNDLPEARDLALRQLGTVTEVRLEDSPRTVAVCFDFQHPDSPPYILPAYCFEKVEVPQPLREALRIYDEMIVHSEGLTHTLTSDGIKGDSPDWPEAPPHSTSGGGTLHGQEGGTHYREMGTQPVDYIFSNALDFFEGNVVKYVTRHRSKNGLEDLKKARHYLDMLIEQEEGHQRWKR